MSEIDLIPGEYRLRKQQMQAIKVFSVILVAVVVISGIVYFYLLNTRSDIDGEISQLEIKKKIVTQQRDDLIHLQQSQSNYENQLTLLKSLRSGDAVEKMLIAIDKTIVDGEVWFKNWKFQRAGSEVTEKPKGKNAGYIIVIPSEDKNGKPQMWKINSHMTIQGQARDHSALSRFVRRLFERPEIQDVRVLKTTLRRYTKLSIVDFDLAIVVDSRAGR